MLTIDNPMPRLCEDTVEISAVDFAKYADQYIEIWSKLEGARIHHSKLGDGKILRVEHRKDYIPLIYLIFDNENEKTFNSESFKVGNVTTIKIPKKLHSLIITDIEKLWCNIDINLASWLNQVTIAIVGQDHTDQLKQERNELLSRKQEAEEQERKRIEVEHQANIKAIQEIARLAEGKIKQKEVERQANIRKDEAKRKNNHAEQVRSRVLERQIPYLVHFTPLYNLPSILQNGLQSRNRLADCDYIGTDESRADGWLDWISLSISFPNYRMFYKKRNLNTLNWIVLIIKKEVLWELECKYILTNASSNEIKLFEDSKWSCVEAFENMFSYKEDRINIPEFYTTDPQAEVMVHDEIPRRYIEMIVVKNQLDQFEADKLCHLKNIQVKICQKLFSYRIDYAHWQSHRLNFSTNW